MLQTARLPPAPVRLGSAGRGVVSLHPVLGVAPLKPAPTLSQGSISTSPISTQSVGQTSNLVSTQASTVSTAQPGQPSTLPSLQPAPLRTVPAQSKVMSASAVVTVAAVGTGPLRSVVAAVPPGATSVSTLAMGPAITSAPTSSAPAPKTGALFTLGLHIFLFSRSINPQFWTEIIFISRHRLSSNFDNCGSTSCSSCRPACPLYPTKCLHSSNTPILSRYLCISKCFSSSCKCSHIVSMSIYL